MPIVEYTPDRFDALQKMVARVRPYMNLAHRPFVDYYYATRSWCKLYLYLSDSGSVLGTLGRELLRFEHESREITIRIGSSWFSLAPGVGGQLSKFSRQSNPNTFGMTLVASREAVKVLLHYGWIPVPGVKGYSLNGPCHLYPRKWWTRVANAVIRQVGGKKISSFASRLPQDVAARITVREEHAYSADLLPRRSPFTFRFAPTAEYLDWRYNLSLSFVRYRLFRVLAGGAGIGYVILNEAPRHILVSQCDGEDAAALAWGVVLAVLEAGANDRRPRTVYLSCCNAEMQLVFERFGFKSQGREVPYGFHALPPGLDPSAVISRWLVNHDWSDNGLQTPFLDQAG